MKYSLNFDHFQKTTCLLCNTRAQRYVVVHIVHANTHKHTYLRVCINVYNIVRSGACVDWVVVSGDDGHDARLRRTTVLEVQHLCAELSAPSRRHWRRYGRVFQRSRSGAQASVRPPTACVKHAVWCVAVVRARREKKPKKERKKRRFLNEPTSYQYARTKTVHTRSRCTVLDTTDAVATDVGVREQKERGTVSSLDYLYASARARVHPIEPSPPLRVWTYILFFFIRIIYALTMYNDDDDDNNNIIQYKIYIIPAGDDNVSVRGSEGKSIMFRAGLLKTYPHRNNNKYINR